MPKCCDAPQSAKPHKCPHLASFKENGGLESFTAIQKYLQTSRLGFLKIPRPRCNTCTSYTDRLHACMQCVFFACWTHGHLLSHFEDHNHFLGVDVTHNQIYCHHCGDYVYDPQLDEIVNTETNNANEQNSLMLEPNRTTVYHQWKASKDELVNLGKNSNPLNVPKKVLGLRGLINLGNTCFMNCILQSFVHNPLMRNYFLSDRHNSKECRQRLRNTSNGNNTNNGSNSQSANNGSSAVASASQEGTRSDVCLGCEMDVLFEQIFSGTKTPYTPHHILHSIWKFANYFAGYEQQDAHEFLISSLNGLHTHLERTNMLRENSHNHSNSNHHHHHRHHNKTNNTTNNNTNNNNNNNNNLHNDNSSDDGSQHDQCNCLVHTIFKGTLRSEVTCSSCGFTSVTEDPFFDISLDIPKASALTLPPDSGVSLSTTSPMSPPQPPSPSSSPLSPVKAGVKRNADEMTQDGFLSPPPAYLRTTSPIPSHSPVPFSSPIASGLLSPPPVSSLTSSLAHTLTACLDRFTQPERLGADEKFLCSKCHTRQESIKQLSMKSLPVVICFHLKRFEQLANSRHSNKIDTFIDFPSVLDMSPYTSLNVKAHTPPHTPSHTPSDSNSNCNTTSTTSKNVKKPSKNSEIQDTEDNLLNDMPNDMFTYHLFAVVNHHGKMDTGHYTCYVKHEETWYKCDDATITVATLPNVLHSKGYLLFYMKHHLQYAPDHPRSGSSNSGSPNVKEKE